MHPDVKALITALEEAAHLLQKHGFQDWFSWLKADSISIQNSDFYGVEHLLSSFGGMGSFNDIVLSAHGKGEQPHLVLIADNERLSVLQTEIYALAWQLAREESSRVLF